MTNIKFSAEKDWTVADLHVFFHQLNILYNRLYVIDQLTERRKGKLGSMLSSSLAHVPNGEQLFVDFIEIHSPAKFSLKGVDKIICQLGELIKDFWYRNSLEKKEGAQNLAHQSDLNEIEVAKQRMELLDHQVSIMKNCGFSDEEIQENFRKLIDPLEKISSVMQHREVVLIDHENT